MIIIQCSLADNVKHVENKKHCILNHINNMRKEVTKRVYNNINQEIVNNVKSKTCISKKDTKQIPK